MLFTDKVILITGSTAGIGETTARQCVAEGARVMIHGLEPHLAQAICADIGDSASYVIADVADPASPAKIVRATLDHFGRIDALMNNAAIVDRSTLETTDIAFFDRMIAINLRAPTLLCREVVPHMRKQGGGVILNTGSINALQGAPNLLAYSIAKGGLIPLTRNLANVLAPDRIRVNQLNVGWTATPNEMELQRREGKPDGWEKELPARLIPSGRLLTPEDVAAHAIFWLSHRSAPTTGVVYEVEQYPVIGRVG